MLSREEILAADDLPREPVPVPEWGGDIWVSMVPAGDMQAYARWYGEAKEAGDTSQSEARIVVMCACDRAGAALFDPDDVPAVAAKNPEVIRRLAAAALRVNDATDKAGEELEGNLDGVPSADSS